MLGFFQTSAHYLFCPRQRERETSPLRCAELVRKNRRLVERADALLAVQEPAQTGKLRMLMGAALSQVERAVRCAQRQCAEASVLRLRYTQFRTSCVHML